MKKFGMLFAVVGLVAIGMSTGASCAAGSAVAADVGTVASCVIQHAAADADPSYENIAIECGGVAVTAVVQIIEALVTAESPSDAGSTTTPLKARLMRVHHAAGK